MYNHVSSNYAHMAAGLLVVRLLYHQSPYRGHIRAAVKQRCILYHVEPGGIPKRCRTWFRHTLHSRPARLLGISYNFPHQRRCNPAPAVGRCGVHATDVVLARFRVVVQGVRRECQIAYPRDYEAVCWVREWTLLCVSVDDDIIEHLPDRATHVPVAGFGYKGPIFRGCPFRFI